MMGCLFLFWFLATLAASAYRYTPYAYYCEAALLEQAQTTARNWLSIGQHLQRPDLYNVAWADACLLSLSRAAEDDDYCSYSLVASKAVQRAEILSLFPVDAVGIDGYLSLSGTEPSDDECSNNPTTIYTRRLPVLGLTDRSTYNYRRFDLPPLDDASIYRDSGITQTSHVWIQAREVVTTAAAGWLGHLAGTDCCSGRVSGRHHRQYHRQANCKVVPLLGAAPLCALVALKPLKEGVPLLVAVPPSMRQQSSPLSRAPTTIDDDNEQDVLSIAVLQRYAAEIADLRSYTTMAHPSPPYDAVKKDVPRIYHSINDNYFPGLVLQRLHRDPGILLVDNFLTADECQRLIAKARRRPHLLQPCLVKNAETGTVQGDHASRTSTNANLKQSEIPTVVKKVCDLLNCHASHLEIFQMLHYTAEQKFDPHTDGFEGPISACGFEDSGRLVTLFCYLNTVKKGGGGETHFTAAGVKIAPVQGTAVVHFPNSVDLREDARTEHEGCPLMLQEGSGSDDDDKNNEKWLLVTWAWKHARSDPRYHEALLPALDSTDII